MLTTKPTSTIIATRWRGIGLRRYSYTPIPRQYARKPHVDLKVSAAIYWITNTNFELQGKRLARMWRGPIVSIGMSKAS